MRPDPIRGLLCKEPHEQAWRLGMEGFTQQGGRIYIMQRTAPREAQALAQQSSKPCLWGLFHP